MDLAGRENRIVSLSRRSFLFAAAALGVKAGGQSQANSAQPNPSFSGGVNVVSVLATVRNGKGEIVRNLNKEDFALEDQGHPQTIAYFSRETDLPLTLGLLVDTSRSELRALPEERRASYQFFDEVVREDKDHAFLIHFDREVELLQDLTSSRKELDKALDTLGQPQMRRPGDAGGTSDSSGGGYPGGSGRYPGSRGHGGFGGGTMLYDAVFLASNELMRKQTGRKAVVVLSDGVDNGSRTSLGSAIESAQRADTLVYSIYFGDEQPAFSPGFGGMGGRGMGRRGGGGRMPPPRADGKKILQQISKETGGAFFEVSHKHPLEDIYKTVQDELRNQYSLGYTPDHPDSGYHKIKVSVGPKGLVVQTREGYYFGT